MAPRCVERLHSTPVNFVAAGTSGQRSLVIPDFKKQEGTPGMKSFC